MPTATPHAPGTFCWPELATSDAKSALAFYTGLFGWTVREKVTTTGAYYLLDLGGREAGAAYEISQAMREQHLAPHWASYVSVANADETARLVQQEGGRVLMGPFDVLELGRMAVVADPQGATFSLWQGLGQAGAGVLGEPGSLGWTQLNAREPARAKQFYTAVLGWTFRDAPLGPDRSYTTWLKSDGAAGGMMPIPAEAPADAGSHWLTYFATRDVDATHALAITLGARTRVPPTDVSAGLRFSVLADPQGASFALMSGSM